MEDVYINIPYFIYPANISNIRTPSAHQSILLPYPVFAPYISSGAKYSGVPHKVYVLLFSIFLAKPKSAIFT
jgi:hypothetical protein